MESTPAVPLLHRTAQPKDIMLHFTKMHGIGNDYVYVDGFHDPLQHPDQIAIQVADRHFGVGGDGLILVMPPDGHHDADGHHDGDADGHHNGDGHAAAHVRMRMFNADGSESEMCGNGIRCVCKFAHDRGLSTANPMRVQTGAGVLELTYTLDDDGMVESVTVDMGEPILASALVPVRIDGIGPFDHAIRVCLDGVVQWPAHLAADWIETCGYDSRMTCVSMGNPHAVFLCDNVERVDLLTVGHTLEHHPMFPKRANIHFYRPDSRTEFTMRTWERGSGITLACGTGACAVLVAGVLGGDLDRGPVVAHLPGGDLTLEWREETNHVLMTGSATEVFTGQIPIASGAAILRNQAGATRQHQPQMQAG